MRFEALFAPFADAVAVLVTCLAATLSAAASGQSPTATPGRFGPFGNGCGGNPAVRPPVTIAITPTMRPGHVSTIRIDHLPSQQAALLLFGASRDDWWGTPLPLALAPLGMTNCELLVAPEAVLPFATGSGTAASTFTVPTEPQLAARRLYFQTMFQQPGLNAAGLGVSRGLATRIAPLPTQLQLVHQITQFGITFHFAQPVPAGQFVNGDWFVVGPATLVDMTPPCQMAGNRVLHGAMINPDASTFLHGYDNALYGPGNEARYIDTLNVARNLSPSNPRVLQPHQSLIKTISNLNPALHPQIETCAILTVLPDAPPMGSFRPPYAGPEHAVQFDESMLDLSVLQSLAPAAGMPTFASQLPQYERPWLDHGPGWPTRYMHPTLNMPDYGRDLAVAFNEGALMANTNAPLADKRAMAIRLVQIGIDFHGNLRGGSYQEGLGGHGSGRKLPILFAGALLGDPGMLAIGETHVTGREVNGVNRSYFGEDAQTFYVQVTGPGQVNWGHGGYSPSDIGLPEWGFSHTHQPQQDTASWQGNSYRRCCTANAWIGAVLCARMMGLREEWNHPALFDYTDRFAAIEPAGWTRSYSGWVGGMWDLYRPAF
jgi:hypothetical protein